MESMTVTKIKPSGKSYTIGDEIPVEGESYQYPDYFDVIVFRDKIAVQIRDRKVSAILPIEEYEYKGLSLINGRGFKILVDSKEKADKLFAELKEQGYKPGSEFFNRWLQFEAYRKIVFRDSIY